MIIRRSSVIKIVNEAEADIRILLTVPASFLLVENFCVAGMATKNEDIVIYFLYQDWSSFDEVTNRNRNC